MYEEIIMKKVTTLFTTTMIALALMMAAPLAMAGKGHTTKEAVQDRTARERVAACRAAITATNPNAQWYGATMGECMAFGRADVKADK